MKRQEQREHYLEVRDSIVRKSNSLVQARFDLSLIEQRILLVLIAAINPSDTEFRDYKFEIGEFCRVCGIDPSSGRNYANLKAAVKSLADRSAWVRQGSKQILMRWIHKAEIDDGSGTIMIRLSDDAKPFLLALRAHYTAYELVFTLRLRSRYSVRLYEFLKSVLYHDLEEIDYRVTLDELRRLLGAESPSYKDWDHLRSRVLKIAVAEINELTDMCVGYTPIKSGRSVVAVEFHVSAKRSLERERIRSEIDHELGIGGQLTLWDQMVERGVVSNPDRAVE